MNDPHIGCSGGVVGLNVALALQREGFAVTVYDRDEARDAATRGASHRNAGGFAFSDIFPLASPGIMARAPGWLLDPLGPLAIRPGHALALMPWLWRFWRATWPERYRAGVAAQTALMTRSQAALERQLQAIGGRDLISAQGQLQVYEGAASFAASSTEWNLRREHGVAFDLLDSPGQIADIQPGLSPRFTHAGFTHGWINTLDPARWMAHLRAAFLRQDPRGEVADWELAPIRRDLQHGAVEDVRDGGRRGRAAAGCERDPEREHRGAVGAVLLRVRASHGLARVCRDNAS